MKKKNIFVLVGHPDAGGAVGSFAEGYIKGAQEAGHEVRRTNIGDMKFDPILHKGYKEIQALEPDLVQVQSDFKWADHIVILYPNWWCTMPAILKGMFDRMFLPGFAFRFKKDKDGNRTGKMEQLLKGKSARIVVTTGTHPFMIRLLYGDFTNELARGILGFAGVSPVRITLFGPCENASEKKHADWVKKMHNLGEKAQ